MRAATPHNNNKPAASHGRPQVVALHGSASSGAQWRRLADVLAVHYDVATPDLPGYGQHHNVLPFGKPTLAGDTVHLAQIARQAGAPIHIVAQSYGAAVAVRFALDNPEAVASLTLIEPVLFHLLRTERALDRVHNAEISRIANAMRIADRLGMAGIAMSRFVDEWNGAGTWRAMTPSLRASLAGQVAQVARNFRAVFAETWSASACRRVQCPTLIITGQNSPGPARRVARILFEAMPQARLKAIPGAGHMAPQSHPETVNRLITEALSRAAPRGADAAQCAAAA